MSDGLRHPVRYLPADGSGSSGDAAPLVVAAYRDRYQITDPAPLGTQPESTTQKIDRARAETALRMLPRGRVENPQMGPERRMERPLQLWPNSLDLRSLSARLGDPVDERQHEPTRKTMTEGGQLDLVDKVA